MMKSELPKQRSSLLVPCVQELAKKPLKQVPPRYVRTDEDSPIVSHTNPSPQVPVLDMAEVFFPRGTEEVASCMQRMGFLPDGTLLQLVNHGVSSELLEKVKMEVQQFFNLPMEEKKKFWQKPDEVEGFGQGFVMSDQQKLNWGGYILQDHPSNLFEKTSLVS
ncbi:hypothetical protein V6N13_039076 [Hibiscus sabdariffa]